MTYQTHPLCEVFPELPDGEYQQLKEDIAKHGILEFGLLYEGKILDGRHRYKASLELGIEMGFCEVDEEDKEFDASAFVLSKNLHRRHLTPSQRSIVADEIREFYDRKAKERQKEAGKEHGRGQEKVPAKLPEPKKADSRDEAGKAAGCSGKLVDAATTVRKLGSPDLRKMVKDGKLAVSKAAEIAKGVKCPEEQIEIAKEYVEDKRKPKSPAKTDQIKVDEEKEIQELVKRFKKLKDKMEAMYALCNLLSDNEMETLKSVIN